MINWERPLFLASKSSRRKELLEQSGITVITTPPSINDGIYESGSMDERSWVQVLAVLKAQNVENKTNSVKGTILAADTVCVIDSQILGQPKNADDANAMIKLMAQRKHLVYTGWCLLSTNGLQIETGCEVAEISIGAIDDEEIEKYVATGNWLGKAGGYNLSEQIAAGWPIKFQGDPTSVMGLPMERLKRELAVANE